MFHQTEVSQKLYSRAKFFVLIVYIYSRRSFVNASYELVTCSTKKLNYQREVFSCFTSVGACEL